MDIEKVANDQGDKPVKSEHVIRPTMADAKLTMKKLAPALRRLKDL